MATDNRRSNLGELEQSAANNPRSGTVPHYGGRYQAGSMTGTKASAGEANDYQRYQKESLGLGPLADHSFGATNSSDYSPGSDYFNNLAGGERLGESFPKGNGDSQGRSQVDGQQSGGLEQDHRAQRDLGNQERDASIDSSKFDGSMNGGVGKGAGGGLKNLAFRGSLARNGALAVSIAGFFTAGFFMIGGLGEMLQAANIFKDFNLGITLSQQAARAFKTTKEVAGLAQEGHHFSEGVKNSRLGFLGRHMAKNMTANLEKNGMTFKSNAFGAQKGIDIDAGKAFSISSKHLEDAGDTLKDELAATLGVNKNKISLNGNKIHLSDKLSYSEAKKVIQNLDDPGKSRIASWLSTRATLKREGFISWLHPWKKAQAALYKKLTDFLEDQFSKIVNPGKPEGGLHKGIGEDGVDDGDAHAPDGSSGKAPDVDIDGRTGAADDLVGKIKGRVGRGANFVRTKLAKIIDKVNDIEKLFTETFPKFFAGAGIVVMIAGFLCLVRGIIKEIGPMKYTGIVLPAEKETGLYMGYASQMMSLSDDNDMKTIEMATQAMLEDDIPEVDAKGEPTGKKYHSSYMDSPAIAKTLGIVGSDKLDPNSGNQGILKTVGQGGFSFLPGPMNDALMAIFNTYGTVADGVCSVFDFIGHFTGGLISGVVDFIKDKVSDVLMNLAGGLLEKNEQFVQLMEMLVGWLGGNPLPTQNATPTEHGNNAMFGSKFLANDQAMTTGGKALSDKQAIELNVENRRFLAWKHSKKPLLARLFDPYDYSSALSQFAYATHLNIGKQDIWLAMGSAVQAMLSAPRIMATAGNQLLGNNAYAASAYDYGVPTYAWSLDEMDEVLNDDTYTMENNTTKVAELLKSETEEEYKNNPYVVFARDCLLADIKREDFSVTPIDNQDGTKFNYVDVKDRDSLTRCRGQMNDPNFKAVRLYVMDYFNTVSAACYHGDDGDSESGAACKEMQVDDVGSGSKSSDGSGNVEATEMQKKFADETHGHYGAYSTSSNGCTTVTAWFISEHTTLTYGHGNGNQVVKQLIAANPGKNLKSEPYPTKAPAIFSSVAGHMHASGDAGHTGVVTSVDPTTGTIHTLESGANNSMNGLSSPWSKTFEWKKEDYSSGVEFVYVGDYLK